MKQISPLFILVLLAGCKTIDGPRPGHGSGPGTSNFYECDRGTRLQVDYRRNRAIVRINGGRPMTFHSTPSAGGPVFEARGGYRLARNRGGVVWNGPGRAAPEQCRRIILPRR